MKPGDQVKVIETGEYGIIIQAGEFWDWEVLHEHNKSSEFYDEDELELIEKVSKDFNVDSPSHYRQLGVECIDVAEHFNYCMGNALKYIWRADYKGDPITDLKKARWYIDREIKRRQEND